MEGEHPGLNGAARRELIEDWRRYFQRWVKAKWLKLENALIVERYFGVPADTLTRRLLTEDEKRIRKAEQLERKARELRGHGS